MSRKERKRRRMNGWDKQKDGDQFVSRNGERGRLMIKRKRLMLVGSEETGIKDK